MYEVHVFIAGIGESQFGSGLDLLEATVLAQLWRDALPNFNSIRVVPAGTPVTCGLRRPEGEVHFPRR